MRTTAATAKSFLNRWLIAVLVSLFVHVAMFSFSLLRESKQPDLHVDAFGNRQQKVTLRLAPPVSTPLAKPNISKKKYANPRVSALPPVETEQIQETTILSPLTDISNTSEGSILSTTGEVPALRSGSSSALLPNGASAFAEKQRSIGSRGVLEKAIKVEITYDAKQDKIVYTTLGDDSDYGGYLTRIVHRFERDMNIPEQAFDEKLNGLLLYDVIWAQASENAESSPIDSKKLATPVLYRKKGTKLEHVNETFDSVLRASVTAIPPPERLNHGPIVARFAFFISLSGGSPLPKWKSGLIGNFIKPCSSDPLTVRLCLWDLNH